MIDSQIIKEWEQMCQKLGYRNVHKPSLMPRKVEGTPGNIEQRVFDRWLPIQRATYNIAN